jgi:hypothetical protein
MTRENLDVDSIRNDLAFLLEFDVLLLGVLCESESSADSDGLSSRELE